MTRVTVIGGGYGGIAIAKALDDVAEVTLVEQKDSFVNHAAALRAAVDREWAERIFLPLSTWSPPRSSPRPASSALTPTLSRPGAS